jgi:ATP-dependent Clp protease ATP-binding subunit ClpA
MFERYTEKARRVIFFARYEASQFGAPAIEPEHLLLGIMREDKTLTGRFFPPVQVSIRKEIEGRTLLREKISTSVELPLAPETKQVLAYAHEESDRLQHRHIGTEHLLLGLLREERSMAAEILYERGLRLSAVRDEIARQSGADACSSQKKEDLVDAVRSFPLKRQVNHCGKLTEVSPFDFYFECPECGLVTKLRSSSGVSEIEDLFDAFCEWLDQPGALDVVQKRQQDIREDRLHDDDEP